MLGGPRAASLPAPQPRFFVHRETRDQNSLPRGGGVDGGGGGGGGEELEEVEPVVVVAADHYWIISSVLLSTCFLVVRFFFSSSSFSVSSTEVRSVKAHLDAVMIFRARRILLHFYVRPSV